MTVECVLFVVLNSKFVFGPVGLVPANLSLSHSLQSVHTWSAVATPWTFEYRYIR